MDFNILATEILPLKGVISVYQENEPQILIHENEHQVFHKSKGP